MKNLCETCCVHVAPCACCAAGLHEEQLIGWRGETYSAGHQGDHASTAGLEPWCELHTTALRMQHRRVTSLCTLAYTVVWGRALQVFHHVQTANLCTNPVTMLIIRCNSPDPRPSFVCAICACRIETISWQPRAFIYHGFLSHAECDHLQELAKQRVMYTSCLAVNVMTMLQRRHRSVPSPAAHPCISSTPPPNQ